MSHLIHPVTGLRALGMGKRGPIWPVLGGSDAEPPATPGPGSADGAPPEPVEHPEPLPAKGFPAGVPVADMSPEEQAAYWKDKARKHENRANAYGLTPKQVTELQARVTEMEQAQLSETERAVEAAKQEAADAGRKSAVDEWQPKYREARMEAIAGKFLDEEQLSSFMAIVDTTKFIDADSGDIDRDAVMGHLTALYGQPKQREFGGALPQHTNWGQYGAQRPAASGIEQANAQLARRHGVKNSNT